MSKDGDGGYPTRLDARQTSHQDLILPASEVGVG